jgi:hypothetical protein
VTAAQTAAAMLRRSGRLTVTRTAADLRGVALAELCEATEADRDWLPGWEPALGRVPLDGVTVRSESVGWIDGRALAWGWDRAQVVRLLLSEGRRVVERKHAKASAGQSVPGWGPRERVVDGGTRELGEAPVDVVDAPVPA